MSNIKFIADDVLVGDVLVRKAVDKIASREWGFYRVERTRCCYIQVALDSEGGFCLEVCHGKGIPLEEYSVEDKARVIEKMESFVADEGMHLVRGGRKALGDILLIRSIGAGALFAGLLFVYALIYGVVFLSGNREVNVGSLFLWACASLVGLALVVLIKRERGFGRFYNNSWSAHPVSFVFLMLGVAAISLAVFAWSLVEAVR